jgi:3-deoxy-D-manno-octulosonic-acid transferase
LMELWQPHLLVFVKFDCWPNQVLAAVDHQVPVVLLAGSLQPKSTRLHPLLQPLYREIFNHFAHIGVCTQDDARRFTEDLGVSSPVTVTGDTRVEQVILRFEAARDGATATELKNLGGRLLILGSTWPPDEKLWLPILPDLLQVFPDLKVVLTPHEPLPERLEALEKRMGHLNMASCRLSQLMQTGAVAQSKTRVILVDSVGVLAEIYRAGHLAYVGGSFTTGVHNTMEPAVASMPVMFGPRIQNAEEAGILVSRQAGFVLKEPAEALAQASTLLSDENLLRETGAEARQIVLEQRGATERSLRAIAPYLKSTGSL